MGALTLSPAEPHSKTSALAQVILGGQDGLVNVLGVVLGVAAATGDTRVILAAGFAATFPESLSMAAVAYTSKLADRDHYRAELARERREIDEVPEVETEEIREIFAAKGFSGGLLEEITAHVTHDKELWLNTMMTDELGLSPVTTSDVVSASIVVGMATLVGSLIPLLPFIIFPSNHGVLPSLALSALPLIAVGVYKAKTTTGKPLRSGIEMAAIGMAAAVIGYAVGLLFRA
jgi:predicted membrane protein (TIGR00267 family)